MMKEAREGFTMVELMFALLLFCTAIIGMAGALVSTSTLQRIGQSRGDMTTLAQNKIEELRAKAVSESDTLPVMLGGSLDVNVPGHMDYAVSADGRVYWRRWEVAAGPGSSRTVAIRVLPLKGGRADLAQIDFHSILLKGE